MFLKSACIAVVFGVAVSVAGAANATVVTYTDKALWTADAGAPVLNTTEDARPTFPYVTTIALIDGTPLSLSDPVIVVSHVGGVDWQTWSGSYTGAVYDVHFSTDITISLSGLSAFGLEIEPADLHPHSISVDLGGGNVITQSVDGDGGALFFGWVGEGIQSFTITSGVNFAFGNIYSVNAAPEPLTLALFGAGLAGIGAIRRRKAAA